MNFDPTEGQIRWREVARDFAREEIAPRAAALDREQRFPYDIIAEMARLGLMGLTLPEEYGGSGGDFVGYNLALEEISRADTSVGITMETHISLGCAPLAAYGTPAQKDAYLSKCATGEHLWASGPTGGGARPAPRAAGGTPAQKDAYLSKCATGEHLWAFGLTEENAGTDAGGTETTAELGGGQWVINGAKKWITNGGTDITAGVTAIAKTGT